MKAVYDDNNNHLHITIYESYVCVHCGERKDVILQEGDYNVYTWEQANEKVKSFEDQFHDKIQSKALVEDMINDAILVDREKLKIVEKLRGERNHETDNTSDDEETSANDDGVNGFYRNPRMHVKFDS